jgi:hypothetical protein
MEVMFEDAHVDGTSAVMPGVPREVPADLVDLLELIIYVAVLAI